MGEAAIVTRFLSAAEAAGALLEDGRLDQRWTEASALPGFTMGELAGHFARAVGVTNAVLARGPAGGSPVEVVRFYRESIASWPQRADLIHENATSEARAGADALRVRWRGALEECQALLASPPAAVATGTGAVLRIHEYLLVRSVELVVHADDLAASLGRPLPEGLIDLAAPVNDFLFRVARAGHGEAAVLRAMTRRERDQVEAVHVL